jgi:hypothetical protein
MTQGYFARDWNDLEVLSRIIGQPIAFDKEGWQYFAIDLQGHLKLLIKINVFERHVEIEMIELPSGFSLLNIPYPACSGIQIHSIGSTSVVTFFPPTEKVDFERGGGCITCPLQLKLTLPKRVEIIFDRNSKSCLHFGP